MNARIAEMKNKVLSAHYNPISKSEKSNADDFKDDVHEWSLKLDPLVDLGVSM